MDVSQAFLLQTLNTVKNNIAVVDENFVIIYTNLAWDNFGKQNGCPDDFSWVGVNYLTPCNASADDGDEFGVTAIAGINQLLAGSISEFKMEYPCHGPTEDRWFQMEISRFSLGDCCYYVISHQNITHRVKLEQEAVQLSKKDGLTGIANRRAFDHFVKFEWEQCHHNRLSFSMMFIDIDDFKQINDNLGHQAGDHCLVQIAQVLNRYTGRATDISARYGGDEFVVAWGNVDFDKAKQFARKVLHDINLINLSEKVNQPPSFASVSIGLATVVPRDMSLSRFIAVTDKLMYQSKVSGKNQITSQHVTHAIELLNSK